MARVGVVNAVHLRRLEDHIRAHLAGAQRGGGVGGEERIAGAGGENNDFALVELLLGFAADEGFRDVFHFDSGLHHAGDAVVFERAFEGERVHDGGEHADVIGGRAVHPAGGGARAAPEIPAADDDAELEPAFHRLADFQGDAVDDFRGNIVAGARSAEGFTAEFENGAFERTWIGWGVAHA